MLRSLDDVAALKETEGGEIHVHGSATLAQGLARAGLVDRYTLLVFPLLLGSAEALRSAAGIPRAPADEPRLRAGVEPARQALSPATWDERYAEGARLSAQEAWRRAQQELTAPAQSPHGAAVPH